MFVASEPDAVFGANLGLTYGIDGAHRSKQSFTLLDIVLQNTTSLSPKTLQPRKAGQSLKEASRKPGFKVFLGN